MFTNEDNQLFDRILEERFTCRRFSDRVPSKEDVEAVIHAGQLAPYAVLSANDVTPFRHFFVMFKGDPRLKIVENCIKQAGAEELAQLKEEEKEDPFLAKYGPGLEKLWERLATKGALVFPDPPSLIIIAEWRGARRAEKQSIAHMVQNMWLKATVMNLDFNLISIIESLTYNKEFCDLLGLPTGRYGFHGCIVGYREKDEAKRPRATTEIHWL